MAVRRWILRVKWTRAREAREEAERVAAEAAKAKAEGHAAVLISLACEGAAARDRYAKERAAIISVQMCARRWVLRRKWRRLEAARLEAARASRRRKKRLRVRRRHSCMRRHSFSRTYAASLLEGSTAPERAAVIGAQMAVRRWILRVKWTRAREAREEAERVAAEAAMAGSEGHAAVLIQSRVRGAAARDRYAKERAAIISVQMCARRWVLRRKRRRLEAARLEAARIAAEEEEAAREAQAQLHAATFIQSHIRGKLARGQHSTERAAVIRAQMAVRRWILQVKWTRAREAREEAERVAAEAAKAKAEGHAAVLIQSRVRCSCTGSLREGAELPLSAFRCVLGGGVLERRVEAAGGGSAGSCAHRGGGRRGCA